MEAGGMLADRPEDRPSAAAARAETARARQALGPERWPVIWADEPFVVPDQFADLPAVRRERRRRPRVWAAAVVLAAAAVVGAAVAFAVTPTGGDGDTPAPRSVPSDAVVGLPDPEGPTAFTACTAEEYLAVAFSPEGYALLCAHVPTTRRYEWTPSTG
ncbi:hypothetical protein [Streptomyces sp. NPDC050848]|uniref:hypothetical protein n=1 Tax=Streptomyces sp. NPDC050848 TaxID=3155791 RepID=UPI0033D3C159